jgi:uncharacterized protein YyaL (SSP411 family)
VPISPGINQEDPYVLNDSNPYSTRNDLLDRLRAAADWVLRSHEACGRTGSAGYYTSISWLNGFRRWSVPYPETTGYIIPSLIACSRLINEPKYAETAINMADWLLTLQANDGWLPGGYFKGSIGNPSVFNTGQIIKGFVAAFDYSGQHRFLDASVKASLWLSRVQDADGAWRQHAFMNGFSPSYYSEVCWPILMVWKLTSDPRYKTSAMKGLNHIRERQKDNGAIAGWGFAPGAKAFTHTIGYTINGMLESALILGEEGGKFWECGSKAADVLRSLQEQRGKLAGQYDEQWKPVYWFACLTGNAQMAICWAMIHRIKGDSKFLRAAVAAFDVALRHQFMPKCAHENRGGIPGSHPPWAKYMKFKHPNWAAKYFMDASMDLLTIIDEG